ncbi:DNA-dependent protein kinase catalytic subunit [Rhizophagus clarus]|uniref:DNA-dependent protein kinase catalytic subunit n=1 Tax=Rhizophagus clarus TaxID=94130 RepID=A0A8H3L6F2_9GLOM|nr:DNA-dependent protein kinase catalytic subunit [Rhizophagus clarus]
MLYAKSIGLDPYYAGRSSQTRRTGQEQYICVLYSLDTLHNCLQELGNCRQNIVQKSSFGEAVGEALRYSQDIDHIISNEIENQELGLATQLLFDPQIGIIKFLNDTSRVTDSVLAKAKIALLEFIFLYIRKIESDIEPYAENIKNVHFGILNVDDEAFVKAASFKPMMAMLDSSKRIIDPEKLNVRDIISRYLEIFFVRTKGTSGVKAKAGALDMLGILAHRFPEYVDFEKNKILRVFLANLKEKSLTDAAFTGLYSFLFAYPDLIKKENHYVFKCIMNSITMVENDRMYSIVKTGLQYIIDHSNIFGEFYLFEYKEIWQCLWKLRVHRNLEVKNAAFKAIWAFLKQIAKVLNSATEFKEFNCVDFFMLTFDNIAGEIKKTSDQQLKKEEQDQKTRDLSIAVRGVGYFAASVKKLDKEERYKPIFQNLLNPSDWAISNLNEVEITHALSQIPLFIEAYCFIGREYDEIFHQLRETIEHEVGLMMVYFPRMVYDLRLRCVNAFEHLLWMFYLKDRGIMQKFVSKSFYQILILTCSDAIQLQSRSDLQNANSVDMTDVVAEHTYQEMFFFWENIFKDSTLSWIIDQSGFSIDENQLRTIQLEFFSILYDEFMSSVFQMLRALNLTVTEARDSQLETSAMKNNDHEIDANLIAIAGSGDLETLQPIVSKDFVLFQNLVDFWQLFLPQIKSDLFSRWVYITGDALITFSTQYPYVSGFYKMLGSCLTVCESIKFFDGIKRVDNENITMHDSQDQLSKTASPAQRASYFLFIKFFEEVSARLSQYKDDLLASCLRLVLSIPRELIDIQNLISPICIALKMGLSYQTLATIGINAIEKLVELQGPQDISKWLEQILPLFNEYLLVKADSVDNPTKEFAQIRNSQRNKHGNFKSLDQTRKERVKSKGQKKSYKTVVGIGQLEKNVGLHDLQVRVLRLLGRLGGVSKFVFEDIVNNDLVYRSSPAMNPAGSKVSNNKLLAWDPERRLSFNIPFPDTKVEIQIDEFLPRIVELAESAPDRKTKIVACELLHSIVIVMIGKSAFQLSGQQQSPFSRIYRNIFPALLRLAIDTDPVPRKIFRRLIAQLIHWYTNNAQYENPETIVLLQCCIDAICNPWGSLRDYGAECLSEFLIWSIKRSSAVEASSMNMKSLLKRLYSLCAHPDYIKRLGASLAINKVYRIFREEEYLVDQFTFELLYWMLVNLRLSDNDQSAAGTRQQAISAIRHLKKIIIVKSNLFLSETSMRRKFTNLNRSDLSSLVEWLFIETGRKEQDYSSICRELFGEFVKLLPDFKTGFRWVKARLDRNLMFLENLYKTSELNPSNLLHKSLAARQTKEWCSQLLSVLANYKWLIKEKFVSPLDLVTSSDAMLSRAIIYFLENLVQNDIECFVPDAMDIDGEEYHIGSENVLTPAERLQWLTRKIQIIEHLIGFIIVLLKETDPNNLEPLWNSNIIGKQFYKLLGNCLLCPNIIGLDKLSDNVIKQKLIKHVETLFTLFKELSINNETQLRQLAQELAEIAFSNEVDLLNIELDKSDPTYYVQITHGYLVLSSSGLFPDLLEHELTSYMNTSSKLYDYILAIWKKFNDLRDVVDPLWVELTRQSLSFALSLSKYNGAINQWLLSDIVGFPSNNSNFYYQNGTIYYQKFSSVINEHISRNFREFAKIFYENINDFTRDQMNIDIVKDIILNLIDYLSSKNDTQQSLAFLDHLISEFYFLKSFAKMCTYDRHYLLKLWNGLFMLEPNLLRRFSLEEFQNLFRENFETFLDKQVELEFKNEALDLLPFYFKSDLPKEKIEGYIEFILYQQLPTDSKDYSKFGTKKLNEYLSVLDKMLKAMVRSRNVSLFKILIPTFCRESDHVHGEEFQRQASEFISKLSRSKYVDTMDIAYGYFTNPIYISFQRNIIEMILSPPLLQGPKIFLLDFFKKHINEIIDLLERDKYGEIVKAYCQTRPLKAKELTRKVMEKAHKIKSRADKDDNGNKLVSEANLHFRCEAYNALAAVILCTQDNPVFYKAFLFAENISKGELLWENIIDLETTYKIKVELNQPFFRSKVDDFKSKSGRTFKETKLPRSLKYIASQYLADSSVTQGSALFNELPDESEDIGNSSESDSGPIPMEIDEQVENKSELELEIDVFNRHPCMKIIIKVIDRLHNQLTKPTDPVESMPGWINDIYKKFINTGNENKESDTHINIRLFIAKIIVNIPEAFEKYASSWIRPIIKLIIEGNSYGEGINYFIQDLCAIVTVWGSFVKLESHQDKVLIYELMEFLMKNSYNESRVVIRNNIIIIKAIFEVWSELIVVPTRVIHELFSDSTGNVDKVYTGLQLLGIVLAHDKPLFQDEVGLDLGGLTPDKFYMDLTNNLLNHVNSNVRALAAEVCGLAVKHLRKYHCSEGLSPLLNPMLQKISGMYKQSLSNESDMKNFLTVIHHISMHDVDVAIKFLKYVFGILPRLLNNKILALEIISFCAGHDPDLLTNLQRDRLLGFLKHRDENEQLLALRILAGVLQEIDESTFEYYLDSLVDSFQDHPNHDCRKFYYIILVKMYNKINETDEIKQKLKVNLLRGLIDTDESIQQALVEFWHTQEELSYDTFTKLKELIGNLYYTETENLFLNYACYLLLEGSKKSIDYNKPIFDQPLPQSRFDENYDDIDTSWRVNNTMTPLFVNTQTSKPKGNFKRQEGLIRATNKDLAFSLTLDPGNAGLGSQVAGYSLTQSNLLLSQSFTQSFKSDQTDQDSTHNSTRNSEYQRFGRQSLKTYSQLDFKQIMASQKKQDEIYRTSQNVFPKNISMLRQYRVGELPDIEINHGDLINPLQTLAQRDLDISRILFTSLYVSIYNQLDNKIQSEEINEYKKTMGQHIQNIFSKTTMNFPPFIGSCLRICYEANDIEIDPNMIRKACNLSSTESLGIILIERQLLNTSIERESKRLRTTNSSLVASSKRPWIELSHLYKSIDGHDVYKSIYESKIVVSELTKDALNAELLGDYALACKYYLEALKSETDVDDIEVALWEERRFECFEKLCQWDDLAETVLVDIEGQLSNLWEDELQDIYLQHFIHSFFKLSLSDDNSDDNSEHRQLFFDFINGAISNQYQKSLLTTQYPIELALSSVSKKDLEQARLYVRKAFDNFLFTWSTLHPLAIGTRLDKLSSLQQIVEIEEFLNLVQSSEKEQIWNKLILRWGRRFPSKALDSSNTWDDIVTTRQSILNEMAKRIKVNHFNRMKLSLESQSLLKMSSAARIQRNFEVARVCLSKIRNLKLVDDKRLSYYQFKLNLREAQNTIDTERRAEILLALSEEFKKIKSPDFKDDMKMRIVESETYGLLISELDKRVPNRSLSKLKSNKNYFIEKGYNLFNNASKETTLKPTIHAKILVKFAKFCDYFLRKLDFTEEQMQIMFDPAQYAVNVVESILQAMENGSKEATELFPRLLQIIEKYHNTQSIFREKVKSVESVWKFIRWIPQIVAILDQSIAHCVFPILFKLAEEFPRSLYYSLTISSEYYKFDESTRENKSKVQELKQMIKCDVTDIFVTELRRLTDSEIHFCNWARSIFTLIKADDDKTEEIMTSFQEMSSFLLKSNTRHGIFAKEFVNRHSEYLFNICGRDGSILARMSQNEFKPKIWDYYLKNIKRQDRRAQEGANLLKSYSSWLAEYSSSNVEKEIEIPGQYDGLSCIPDPNKHVKISSFDPKVMVLRSLRKPKRISILGTDGNEYLFLVKGGEDLRLDQRVQQLFSLMNEIMKKDSFCSQRNITQRTYKVVPITGRLGLIEWINYTTPMRVFIERELNDSKVFEDAQSMHSRWVQQYQTYQKMFMEVDRNTVVQHFKVLQREINNDLLKRALYKLAASPEAHLSIRSEFVKCHAAINICGYLIGIGDRHLENFLIDMKKGSLISIDFGHAFGSATETLEVPELIPFRLTKQTETLMEPLGSRGLLEYPMIKILQIMQANKDILLNAMDIFVKEPLLDWLTRANDQKNRNSNEIGEENSQTMEWYPRQKLDIARRKLELENPAYIICDELKAGHSNRPWFGTIIKIAKGDPNHNIRALACQKCFSVKEQVECLIDLATDPYVLGSMWVGWQSWV